MLNLFTNKRLSSEIELISRCTLITEPKQEIYLFTTLYRDRSAFFLVHLLFFFFAYLLDSIEGQHTAKMWLSILLEIHKQLFQFNLSINSVTHGNIM